MVCKKCVLITGASSGIGRVTAEYLNSVGYQVVLVARNREKLEFVAKGLSDDTVVVPYDLQDLAGIEQIFVACKEKGIVLYGMAHCAGINRDQPVKTNNLQDMEAVMNTNLLSFIELSKYFSKKKYSCDGGGIVGISSTAALGGAKGMCTYTASKAGLDAAVRVMSKEFARRKIRVNSIQPSWVDTDMARSTNDFELKVLAQPLGVIDPVHIAYLIEFLLSDKAMYISGSNLKVSGACM